MNRFGRARRQLLAGPAVALLMVACGGDDPVRDDELTALLSFGPDDEQNVAAIEDAIELCMIERGFAYDRPPDPGSTTVIDEALEGYGIAAAALAEGSVTAPSGEVPGVASDQPPEYFDALFGPDGCVERGESVSESSLTALPPGLESEWQDELERALADPDMVEAFREWQVCIAESTGLNVRSLFDITEQLQRRAAEAPNVEALERLLEEEVTIEAAERACTDGLVEAETRLVQRIKSDFANENEDALRALLDE